MYGAYPHGDWGWGVPAMIVLMFAFWVILILGVAWLVRRLEDRPRTRRDARAVLERRFAEGEIDEVEYRARMDVLVGTRTGGTIDDDG